MKRKVYVILSAGLLALALAFSISQVASSTALAGGRLWFGSAAQDTLAGGRLWFGSAAQDTLAGGRLWFG